MAAVIAQGPLAGIRPGDNVQVLDRHGPPDGPEPEWHGQVLEVWRDTVIVAYGGDSAGESFSLPAGIRGSRYIRKTGES